MKKVLIAFLIFGIFFVGLFWFKNKNINPLTTQISDSFVFAVQADPHMDEQSDETTYKNSLASIKALNPSFLIDLGDTYMIDKLTNKSSENIKARYDLMDGYFSTLGNIPVYKVLGNHDGQNPWDKTKTQGKTFYQSFTKNNALFIVLDPYSYTIKKPNTADGWTLGQTQLDWLKTTLENSKEKFKFIFIHQLVGGDGQGRGGVEVANLGEWGKVIHPLLVVNKVNIVFKGHDHLYAKQDLDGIVYQTLPQPSHPGNNYNPYTYTQGKIIGGSGFLKVTVSLFTTTVDFLSPEGNLNYAYQVK